jgi:hypothetical protein
LRRQIFLCNWVKKWGEQFVAVCCLKIIQHLADRWVLKTESYPVSAGRLELPTNGLKGHCSTIELRAHFGARQRREHGLHFNMAGLGRQRRPGSLFDLLRSKLSMTGMDRHQGHVIVLRRAPLVRLDPLPQAVTGFLGGHTPKGG